MTRRTVLLTALLALCPLGRAAHAESNKNEVQAAIKQGWDVVAFGKELDHGEYAKLAGTLAASLAGGDPSPLLGYVKIFLDDSARILTAELKQEIVLKALSNPGRVFRSGQWEVSGGIASYEHWRLVKVEVPDGVEIRGTTIRVRMKMHTTTVQLPNTHQPYIRVRLIPTATR